MYEYIDDDILKEINETLDWHSGIELPDGRILGSLTRSKRDKPETIPDRRIEKLESEIGLQGKRILEIGCFEGAHTLGFLKYTKDVTAIDIRPSNVINTLTRLSVMGEKANVHVCNVEDLKAEDIKDKFDIVFHCGVFYHLKNPVKHFESLKGISEYILLDTHIAKETESKEVITGYSGMIIPEGGWLQPFAGKDVYAIWLCESSLRKLVTDNGYKVYQEWEYREERNGDRICWLLKAN